MRHSVGRCPVTMPIAGLLSVWVCFSAWAEEPELKLPARPGVTPKNVVFILVDDHRYDAMGFVGHPFLKTPSLDRLAKSGVHLANAFVTTSLCSPSRASILTGRYMHHHRVVDNNSPAPPGTVYFPQYLQHAGYQTGFFGKWHMGGDSDAPQPGFDRWVAFRGQGHYLAPGPKYRLNVDGKPVPQNGYITDELTDYALQWLDDREQDKPFFLYLSHKAVHAEFIPAERHRDLYSEIDITLPSTADETLENPDGKPMWVHNQRNSWHGVDYPYHSDLDVREYYRQYCRTLAAVDESVERVLAWLEKTGHREDTVVIYMGDNGFLFGEHGLIDKRNAYEESMRVPLIASCPGTLPEGTTETAVVANIDIAPTILELAGLTPPTIAQRGNDSGSPASDDRTTMDGESFLGLLTSSGRRDGWRTGLLYEYYWEYNFPHTPTMFALRGDQYKLILYQGVWDSDELYDIKNDPKETTNLYHDAAYQMVREQMRRQLYKELERSGGMMMPLAPKRGEGANLRHGERSDAAEFPARVLRGSGRNSPAEPQRAANPK